MSGSAGIIRCQTITRGIRVTVTLEKKQGETGPTDLILFFFKLPFFPFFSSGKDSLAAPPAEQRKGRRTEGIGQKPHQYKETLNMFKTITRLLFGGEEETPEDVKPAEVVEEGWLLVNHQEAVSAVSAAEDQDAELADCTPSNPTAHKVDDINQTGSKMSEPEPSVQSSSSSQVIRNSLSQAEALAKVTQVTRVQRAQAWAERHHLSRSAIQRHNCGRQRGQRHHSLTHSTYLHQPGHRNLSH